MSKETRTLTVSGMSCSHCEYVIKKAVGTLNGVEKVTVNLEAKRSPSITRRTRFRWSL